MEVSTCWFKCCFTYRFQSEVHGLLEEHIPLHRYADAIEKIAHVVAFMEASN